MKAEYIELLKKIPQATKRATIHYKSTDYDEDPCGQVNKICEIAEKALKVRRQLIPLVEEPETDHGDNYGDR